MFKLTPVTSKIGQGHPSSNLTNTNVDGQTDRQTDGQTDRQTDRPI